MGIVLRNLILILSLGLFIIGLLFSDPYVLLISVLIIILQNFWYGFEKFYERIIFITFNATFFIFLLGRIIVSEYFNYNVNNSNLFGLAFFDAEVVNHILISLYISLLSLFIGFHFVQKFFSQNSTVKEKIKYKTGYLEAFRIFSKYFFYFTVIFRLMYLYEAISVSNTEGYYETFATFQSQMPLIFIILSNMYDVAFFAFLATKPRKKESVLPIGLYIIEGIFSLLSGRRSGFMLNLLIIFIYFCLRNKDNKENIYKSAFKWLPKKDKWVGKKEIIATILALPLIMVLLNMIGYLRAGSELTNVSLINSLYEFFYSQGISVNVIGFAKTLADTIPEGKLYSIGPIIEFFDNKIIGHYIFGQPIFIGQTVERALNGYLFSHTISYLIMPRLYLMGIGYGSSYIAELYTDFGYIGIIIGSIIYGILISKFTSWFYSNNILIVLLILLMTRALLFTPRAGYTSFLVSTFSLPKIAALIIIFIGAYIVREIIIKKRERREFF
ncbi:O-antigen polysaccharide polymerase Wzy family protein [Alkalihalobacterium chitinilyticum]|uniref:O-antigen polysaccharide polymerase Wzy family protein n=1 Tax=Alkalihalobacterium chitinilyticum TaxID=2980103 RepID=A0ABT5VNI9_9BACI|nr:O-antigen polysaccharide polymerase Wzy family protein [Alkalihalobacterium chitinilyticum]MDE5415844.1 O-antigen polysaccharide polymerase Wzy family protein [Alkalihalobacterium chitinilyticum]